MTVANIQNLFAVSEVELVYRSKVKPADRPQVFGAASAYDILLTAWDKNKIEMVEQFNILVLDRQNHCLSFSNIATGGISECSVDAKVVFATALKQRGSGIILAHNHPSGSLKPSSADERITELLCEGGKILQIPIRDHLIVSPRGYFSFVEEGLLFWLRTLKGSDDLML